jgi:hypothetical protein
MPGTPGPLHVLTYEGLWRITFLPDGGGRKAQFVKQEWEEYDYLFEKTN